MAYSHGSRSLSANNFAVIGGNSARSLAFLLATASVGGIFASFATDIGEKASTLR